MSGKPKPEQDFREAELSSYEGRQGQKQTVTMRYYYTVGLLQYAINSITEFGSTLLRGHLPPGEINKLKAVLGIRKATILVHIKGGKIQIYGNDATIVVKTVNEDQDMIANDMLDKLMEENPIRL